MLTAAGVLLPTTRSLGSLNPSAEEAVVGKVSQVCRAMYNRDRRRAVGAAVVVVVGREPVGSLMDRGLEIERLALTRS